MYSSEAAEQIVRMSLEGVEVAAKITGESAKTIAVLLAAVLREEHKTKGKARLAQLPGSEPQPAEHTGGLGFISKGIPPCRIMSLTLTPSYAAAKKMKRGFSFRALSATIKMEE